VLRGRREMKTKGALAAEVLKRAARKRYTGNQKKGLKEVL
jgi:hypothetical protein